MLCFSSQLDSIHERIAGQMTPLGRIEPQEYEAGGQNTIFRKFIRVMKVVIKILHPLVHSVYEGSFLLFQILYLNGLSDFHSPLHYIVNNVLRKVSPDDLNLQLKNLAMKRELSLTNAFKSSKIFYLLHVIRNAVYDNGMKYPMTSHGETSIPLLLQVHTWLNFPPH